MAGNNNEMSFQAALFEYSFLSTQHCSAGSSISCKSTPFFREPLVKYFFIRKSSAYRTWKQISYHLIIFNSEVKDAKIGGNTAWPP